LRIGTADRTGSWMNVGTCSLLLRDGDWSTNRGILGILRLRGIGSFGIENDLSVVNPCSSEISIRNVLGPNFTISTEVLSESQGRKSNVVEHHCYVPRRGAGENQNGNLGVFLWDARVKKDLHKIQDKNPNAVIAEVSSHAVRVTNNLKLN
jgi:hypothetical protein